MNNKIIAENNDIVFYKGDNGETNIELLINGETLWVTQKTMAEIFDVQRHAITKHLKNIFEDGELDKNQVCSKMEHTASNGKTYNTEIYNLDAIISHKQAIDKAHNEYEKYRVKQDQQYISSMDEMYKKVFRGKKKIMY